MRTKLNAQSKKSSFKKSKTSHSCCALDVSLSPCVTAGPNSGVTELRSAIRCNSSRPTDRSARAGTAKKPLTRTPYMAINNHLPIDRVLNQPPPNRGRSVHPSIPRLADWISTSTPRAAPAHQERPGGRRRSPATLRRGGISMHCSFVNAAPPGGGGRRCRSY